MKRINIFDLDSTLIVTNSKIKIFDQKTGNLISALSPEEYNNYVKQDNHILNFDDFQNMELLKQGRIINWVFQILKKSINKGRDVGIITMRPNQRQLYSFFHSMKIHIPRENIFTVSDPKQFDLSIPGEQRKLLAMKKFIERGYTKIRFFDDHKANLDIMKSLGDKYPKVDIKTKLIKQEWIPKL